MRDLLPELLTLKLAGKTWRIPRSTLRIIALWVIITLAAFLRFANLGAIGDGNHYYTATVESMLKSWHNFFFAAAEPGGSVSVDKPPVGFWLQAISAYFLGVNGLGVMLPQIMAGILSVVVVYHLVRRSFGTIAGLLAALALAITPIVIATDRNNTIDSTLILTLLLATWAFIKATETSQMRFLLLGAVLVGIGFNIKMLQAYLPLPAFFALYMFGSGEKIWQKMGKLVLATGVLLIVSLSWAVVVDLTPASQRPYVGGSRTNSEISLILNYNGIERLTGMGGMGGKGAGGGAPQGGGFPNGGSSNQTNPNQTNPMQNGGNNSLTPGNANGTTGGSQYGYPQGTPNGNNGMTLPQGVSGNDQSQPFGGRSPGGPGGGFAGTGQRSALRLFTAPLSKEVSWLLPFGLVSIILLMVGSRLSLPVSKDHQALVLWGGWLMTCVVFFSIAGFFHEYYLSMLAPPLAALVGIGVVQLWRLFKKHRWLGLGLALLATGGTLAFQWMTAKSFINPITWYPWAIGLFAAGALFILGSAIYKKSNFFAPIGFALLVSAMLVTPGIWSGFTTFSTGVSQNLPSAYGGGSLGVSHAGGLQVDETLLEYLQSHTEKINYLMAVPSSQTGSDYVLATGRPVLYLGGFGGQDQVVTLDELVQMVKQGELRYFLLNGGGRDFGNKADISSWVASSCVAIESYDIAMSTDKSMDNATIGLKSPIGEQGSGFPQGPGGMQQANSLYDCGE